MRFGSDTSRPTASEPYTAYGADRVGIVGKPRLLPVRNVTDLTDRDHTSYGPPFRQSVYERAAQHAT